MPRSLSGLFAMSCEYITSVMTRSLNCPARGAWDGRGWSGVVVLRHVAHLIALAAETAVDAPCDAKSLTSSSRVGEPNSAACEPRRCAWPSGMRRCIGGHHPSACPGRRPDSQAP